jgi:hypothetical protein
VATPQSTAAHGISQQEIDIMRSSSRNSRKPFQALGLAAAVSLLLGSAAQADDQRHNFVLTAYSNGTGGDALLSGDYDTAIKQLHAHEGAILALQQSTVSNNRCVALTMSKQWAPAKVACDEAVRNAEQDRVALATYNIWSRSTQNDYVAVALSNRAVLHWMSDEQNEAASDLKRAESLSPRADFVARNRAALESKHATVAQVLGATQR